METNSHIKMAALAFAFIVCVYVFFVYSNLQSTYVQDIANNSEVQEEGFSVPEVTEGFSVPEVTEGFQNETVVEGFEGGGRNARRTVQRVEGAINEIDDMLHIEKYRKDYEELISKADDLFELGKLRMLVSIGEMDLRKDPMRAMQIAWALGMMGDAKPALESLQSYLDSK